MVNRTVLYQGSVLACLILVQGCATSGKSIGAGAGIGGLMGGGVGAMVNPGKHGENRIRNILIGTAIGGAVGAGSGYVAHRLVQDEKDDSYKKGKDDTKKDMSDQALDSATTAPSLIPPKTEAFWVPDQVRGQTFVPAHFEYRIIESAHWEVKR